VGGRAKKIQMMLRLRKMLKYRKMVEKEIKQLIPAELSDFHVYKPIHYMLDAGGKFVRPILMILSCEAVGGNYEDILPGASGIELGHVASLVHDDIIDGSHIRRGVVSIHEKFGVHDAILSGDLLIFHTFLGLAKTSERGASADRVVDAIKVLAKSGIDLVVGQELESKYTGKLDTTEEEYIHVIRYKTGSYLRDICKMGAIIGGGNEKAVNALAEYGENLGIAFQIKDDILSLTKSEKEIMKTPESDIKQKTVTLPIIYALNNADADDSKEIKRIFSTEMPTREDFLRIAIIVKNAGVIPKTEKTARSYAEKAEKSLNIIPSSPSKKLLLEFVDFVVERTY